MYGMVSFISLAFPKATIQSRLGTCLSLVCMSNLFLANHLVFEGQYWIVLSNLYAVAHDAHALGR
jgi:hypothetical protein